MLLTLLSFRASGPIPPKQAGDNFLLRLRRRLRR